MRKLMKLIVITAMAAMLLFALVTCAAADEKIYTSPVFKLPRERLERAEEIIEAQEAEEEAAPEEAEEPDAEAGEDESPEDVVPEGAEPEGAEPEGAEPEGAEPEDAEPEDEEPEDEEPEDEEPEGAEPEGEEPEDEDPEDEEPEDEDPDEDEDFEELDEDAGEVTEPAKPKHEVIIRSSQGEVVTAGDVITLTSELRGFSDDEQVEYQWQVDRGNGDGWEEVAGANKYKFVFVADRENIRYSWRLIVTIVGQDE